MRHEIYEQGDGPPADRLVETREVDAPDALPTEGERLATLEAKMAAVEALATQANVTAQEVAAAAKNARPT